MLNTMLRHRTVTTEDGVVLPVVETGRPYGSPVVFVHGLASSSAEFAGVMSDPRLATYRLVAVDLRGHGAQHQQLEEAQITASDPADVHALWVRDLHAVLVDLSRAHLVGSSFGATVVQTWLSTADHADTVAGVTLVAGVPAMGPAPDDDPVASVITPEAGAALGGAASGGQDDYAARVLSRGGADASIDPELLATVAAIAAGTQPAAVVAGLIAPFDHREFWTSRPEHERARVQTIVCQEDQIFAAPALQRCWEQAGLTPRTVPGACHSFPLRDPEGFAGILLQALQV